ncbi:hypothetical protein ZYGR_0AF01450 [Zygosaccharomyces rouxii]|uniref:Uncharacterized protein n=1 Tax=Zygosaccharomyces rouxii TaxID=4956 RepID=A0A1Q3A7G1_ZYGRO|nr:hypothetical protein ZYGR_0AF01450 [Zygosaccharomyces rouxii]
MCMQDDKDNVLKNAYRHIKLYADLPEVTAKHSKHHPNDERQFRACVSFDTVPLTLGSSSFDDPSADFPGVQIPPEFSLDDLCSNKGIARRVASNHNDYYSPRGPASQNKRLTRKSLADSFKRSENGKIVRVDYPSEPAIFNDALILTRSKGQWHQMWSEKKAYFAAKLDEKYKWFQYPTILFPPTGPKSSVMSSDGFTPLSKEQRRKEKVLNLRLGHLPNPRTILCYISGRRHTWVALDWVLRQLAQDTDHIVIVANLPKFSSSISGRSRSKVKGGSSFYRSLSVGPNNGENEAMHDNFMEWSSGYNKYDVERKIMDIFEYIKVILPPKLAVKITVEVAIGKTKKVMLDAVNCYTPDFCVEGTLKWERTDNLIVWKSRLLKDVLSTKFSIPVFVVPAKRLFDFEAKMERDFLPRGTKVGGKPTEAIKPSPLTMETLEKTKSEPSNFDSTDSLVLNYSSAVRSDIEDDIDSNSGQDSDEDDLTVKEKLSLARQTHRKNMMKELRGVESNNKLDYAQKKVGALDSIIKQTLEFSEELQNITEEDFKGDSGEELHNLKKVITGSTKVLPNSKKSMLDVLDTPKSVSPHRHQRSGQRKPRSGQIKFAPNVNAKDGNKALGNSRGKNYLDVARPSLGPHSYSHNQVDGIGKPNSGAELRRVSTGDSTIPLRKVVSANNVARIKSNDSNSLSPIHSSGSIPGSRSSSSRRNRHSKKSSGGRSEGSGGLLSFLIPSGSRSHSQSRRSSSGSDSERSSVKSPSGGKKKRSFFGW